MTSPTNSRSSALVAAMLFAFAYISHWANLKKTCTMVSWCL